MGVITRANHPDALWPGVKSWFGNNYKQLPKEWPEIFEQMDSDKAYERVAETTGFGLAAVKSEGASITYDSDAEGVVSTFTHVVYGLGFIVTREEIEDLQYDTIARGRSKALSRSMRTTEEVVHANILNRAFDTNYPGGDGKPLVATDHPTRSGPQSNLLTAADFSEAALEDGLKQIAQMRDARGLNVAGAVRKLVVSTGDMFAAERILGSTLRPGTANNDLNAVKAMGAVPGGVVVNHYLTDTDAWFLLTDIASDGLLSFWRRRPSLERDNEFDTENQKAKSTMRFAAGWADWRAIYGNPGA